MKLPLRLIFPDGTFKTLSESCTLLEAASIAGRANFLLGMHGDFSQGKLPMGWRPAMGYEWVCFPRFKTLLGRV